MSVDQLTRPGPRAIGAQRGRLDSAEERLIIASSATERRRRAASARIADLTRAADWDVLADLLAQRRLLPLLGPRLVELAGEDADAQFTGRVAGALDVARRRGVFLQAVGARVTRALGNGGIRCATLKGPDLSEALYGDPGRRVSSDVDILVAPDQLCEAVEIVRGLGYRSPSDHVDSGGLPLLHFALVHARDELPPVELHWRVHWYEQEFARQRLLPTGPANASWRPAAVDQLAALLLFYARDGFVDLRPAVDVGACWDAVGAEIDADAFDRLLDAHPALESVLLAAAKVAENVVGVPMQELTGRRSGLGVRGRIAVRLATPHPRPSDAQLRADMGLIDGLLVPRRGFGQFLRRQLVPPREVLRQRAIQTSQRRPTSTVGHLLRVLARYAIAIVELALRPQRRKLV
jgi:Uncharacterised nucleotidyltransferase